MPACSCTACVSACKRTPGWFTPEEADRAIAAGVPLMTVNAYGIRILAPAAEGRAGEEVTYRPGSTEFGRCSQLTSMGLCAIHADKPHECRESMPHERAPLRVARMHQFIAAQWAASRTSKTLGVS